ncbi:MAG: glycosyltransferase family 39 protein [Bacteroidota bacterium]
MFKFINNKHLPFWLTAISFFIALIVPTLIKDGMFMDGMLYTCVSKNLANGLGSFWFPNFSKTIMPSFHEHPPLVFGIQSLFFSILGNSLYVERFYSFLTACITGFLIILMWKQVFDTETELKKLSWLPFFYWIIFPLTFWSFSNNMQENTMGIFTLSSAYLIIKGLKTNRHTVIYLIFSGILIFLGTLCKGFPGLFPLVIVGLYWIIYKNTSFRRMIIYTLILILVPMISYSVLLLDSEIFESLSRYLFNRAINRIQTAHTVDNRFFIVQRLFMELLPAILVSLVLVITYKYKSFNFRKIKTYKKSIILFLLIGVSGSFPLMLTMVQKGFYMVHSFPFYAIGMAIIVAPGLAELIKRINTKKLSFKIYKVISISLLISTIIFSALQIGKAGRDENTLHDVYLIGEVVPEGSTIGIDPSIKSEWSLYCYFSRYFYISLKHSYSEAEYFMTHKTFDTNISNKYRKIPLATRKYDLYHVDSKSEKTEN